MPTTLPQAALPAWQLQDAKAQFSALVDSALRGVPQRVTRRGKQAVVVLSAEAFEALQRSAASQTAKPVSLVDHLLAMPKTHTTVPVQQLELQPRPVDWS